MVQFLHTFALLRFGFLQRGYSGAVIRDGTALPFLVKVGGGSEFIARAAFFYFKVHILFASRCH